jgi:16S rRNA (guanine527-N7)-methyltransferase
MSAAPAPPDAVAVQVRDAAAFAEASGAAPERMAELERFRRMLEAANRHMNLVGPSTLPEFWSRHAWDSAQLLPLAPAAEVWADIGAGAGFPGLVLAILLKKRDGARVHLIESMAKRCRFLTEVVSALDLPAEVHNVRAETLSLKVDAVTARAVAPVTRLIAFAKPYLDRGALGLFLKGQDVGVELAEATRYWKFDADLLPSRSDARGRILRLEGPVRARR